MLRTSVTSECLGDAQVAEQVLGSHAAGAELERDPAVRCVVAERGEGSIVVGLDQRVVADLEQGDVPAGGLVDHVGQAQRLGSAALPLPEEGVGA